MFRPSSGVSATPGDKEPHSVPASSTAASARLTTDAHYRLVLSFEGVENARKAAQTDGSRTSIPLGATGRSRLNKSTRSCVSSVGGVVAQLTKPWLLASPFLLFCFYDVFSHFGFFCLVYLYRILFLKLFYFLFVSFARRKPPRDVEQQSASCLRWKSKEALHKLASRETLRLRPFTFQKEGMTRLSASLSHG